MRFALLLALLLACQREEAPSPTPTPTPSPTPTPTPSPTPAAAPAPDAAPGCDESALLAAATAVAACKSDDDCTLTYFGGCSIGGQVCSNLAHARTADLTPYRDALAAYSGTCNRQMRCRCAQPDAAVCRAGLCEAVP